MNYAKVPIYRNNKLLSLAKDAPKCFMCNRENDGTVVAAHANMGSLGKGIGMKAADIPAYLCETCHSFVDGRIKSDASQKERNSEWALAAIHSLRWALETHPEIFR